MTVAENRLLASPRGKRKGFAKGVTAGRRRGFGDHLSLPNMGFGVLINGLASLMIGEALLGRGRVSMLLLAPFTGAIIYYHFRP